MRDRGTENVTVRKLQIYVDSHAAERTYVTAMLAQSQVYNLRSNKFNALQYLFYNSKIIFNLDINAQIDKVLYKPHITLC
jgi:hypothetical protein